MSDTPKLVVLNEFYPSSQSLQREPSVAEVAAWLREQGWVAVGTSELSSMVETYLLDRFDFFGTYEGEIGDPLVKFIVDAAVLRSVEEGKT